MNNPTYILDYIQKLAHSDPLVNEVTTDETDKAMFDKITMFPLLHISIGDFSYGDEFRTVIWQVDLLAVKVRQNKNEQTTDSFLGNTNKPDNFNETFAILNRLVSRIGADLDKKKNKVSTIGNGEPLDEFFGSQRDGFVISLSLELPNNEISLCQYPIA